MDISRYPFSQLARLHDSESAPLIEQRWFFTDLPYIGGLSLFNNRHLDSDQWKVRPLGSAADWIDRQRYNGNWTKPPGLTGKHMCHPEWFATGQPWPVTTPPTVYGPSQIPECCGLHVTPMSGGLEIGGAFGDVRETASGVREFIEPGEFVFVAEFTGDHRLRVWAAGGGGGRALGFDTGGGGGGGAYSEIVVPLVVGNPYLVVVGAGGVQGLFTPGGPSMFKEDATVLCFAEGGTSATLGTAGVGGSHFSGLGTTLFDGGDGETGGGGEVGGGGSSAGITADGNPGVGAVGGIAPAGGGDGGDGGADDSPGANGHRPGGGGGGAGRFYTGDGTQGGGGTVVIEWPA